MAAAAGDPIEDLSQVPPEVLDALPYGAIQLTGDGVITAYSRAESELSGLSPDRVIGKNFFRQVAPCTAVREFQGALEESTRQGRERPSEAALCFYFRARGKTSGSGNGLSRRHRYGDAARASCAFGTEALIERHLIVPAIGALTDGEPKAAAGGPGYDRFILIDLRLICVAWFR